MTTEDSYELIDFGDLLPMAIDADFLIDPILPIGFITLLAARGGSGKSAYALYLADKLVGEGKKVLYLDGESCTSIFKKRCYEWKLQNWQKIKTLMRNTKLEKNIHELPATYCPVQISQIESAVSKYLPDLLIIDSLTFLGNKLNLNDKQQVSNLFLALTRIAAKYTVAILILAHTKKKQNSDDIISLDSVAGSGTITDFSKSVLLIEEEPGTYNRIVKQVKNNIKECANSFSFSLTATGVTVNSEISTTENNTCDRVPEIRLAETKIAKIKRRALELLPDSSLELKEIRRILKKEEHAYDAEIKTAIDWACDELKISIERISKN